MARMPISGATIESMVEAGSAIAAGAGLHYAYVGPISKNIGAGLKEALQRTLLVDLATGIVGTVGAMQLRGTFSNISSGVAMGALGHLGAMLVQYQMLFGGSQQTVPSYGTSPIPSDGTSPSGTYPGMGHEELPPDSPILQYRTGSYAGGYSSMPVLEI